MSRSPAARTSALGPSTTSPAKNAAWAAAGTDPRTAMVVTMKARRRRMGGGAAPRRGRTGCSAGTFGETAAATEVTVRARRSSARDDALGARLVGERGGRGLLGGGVPAGLRGHGG